MTPQLQNLRFTPWKRLLYFLLITAACLLAGMVVIAIVTYKGVTPARLRLSTLVQSVMVFLLPSLLVALTVTYKPWKFLKVTSVPVTGIVLGVFGLLVGIPLLNWIADWNAALHLPDSMGDVELWMRMSESEAEATVQTLMGGTTVWDLILGILLIGILPGLAEEFYFRGSLQRVLATTSPLTPHAAIWIAAFIFSGVHMQFFGFFPRLLLGAYFGYLLYWTGSLWVPVTVHAVNNTIIVVNSWLARCGTGGMDLEGVGTQSWVAAALSAVLLALTLVALSRKGATNVSPPF